MKRYEITRHIVSTRPGHTVYMLGVRKRRAARLEAALVAAVTITTLTAFCMALAYFVLWHDCRWALRPSSTVLAACELAGIETRAQLMTGKRQPVRGWSSSLDAPWRF